MDYQTEWVNLRTELYATLKTSLEIGIDQDQLLWNVLLAMIDREDLAAGIDIGPRHQWTPEKHDITPAEVIALYDARER